MAKNKKQLFDQDADDSLVEFNPESSTAKLPVDISGGKKPIPEYMEVPCNQIITFRQKGESDFRPYPEEKFQMMVESVRETGVIEAITLRALPDGKYELLVGEHRWKASVAAGKETVPAHVLANLSDEQAREYFSITNLLRRDTSMLDRVNGWWHYYESHGYSLRGGANGGIIDLAVDLDPNIKDSNYTIRHIYRYIRAHDLIPKLKERLDASFPKKLALMTGYYLAFLPIEKQQWVADLNCPISEEKAKRVNKAEQDGILDKAKVKELLIKQKPVKKMDFRSLNRLVKKIATEQIDPKYRMRANKIIEAAIAEYLEKNPKYKKEE